MYFCKPTRIITKPGTQEATSLYEIDVSHLLNDQPCLLQDSAETDCAAQSETQSLASLDHVVHL